MTLDVFSGCRPINAIHSSILSFGIDRLKFSEIVFTSVCTCTGAGVARAYAQGCPAQPLRLCTDKLGGGLILFGLIATFLKVKKKR